MKFFIVALVIFVSACAEEPLQTSRTSNPNVPVSKLLQHDGCTVYRFYDGGRHHYYVRCDGNSSTSTLSTRSCGKGCTEQYNIDTEVAQ